MRQRRNRYTPSSGAKLAALITSRFPLTYGKRSISPESARKYLTGYSETVARLAGPAGVDWAINQLSTPPYIAVGCPRKCKAARMRLRKAVSK